MPAAVLGARPKSCPVSKQQAARRETLDKWERRNLFTHRGQKVLRIQPSVNNDSLSKYQSQDSSADGSPGHSTPPVNRPWTASPMPISSHPRSGVTEEGRPKTPFVFHRDSERDSSEHAAYNSRRRRASIEKLERPNTAHSVTYSTRSSACTPPNLYNQDKLRQAMREKQPSGHANRCEYASRNQPKQEEKLPKRFGKPIHLPGFVKGNEFLTHQDLTMGQKQYIWGIAQVYSVTQLKVLKQRQYQALLDYEFTRRLQNKELSERKRIKEIKEYMKYSKFIHTYEQRIPKVLKGQEETYSPCQELHHLHKHSITGWTTKSPTEPERAESESEDRDHTTDNESGERTDKDNDVTKEERKVALDAEEDSETANEVTEDSTDEEAHTTATTHEEDKDGPVDDKNGTQYIQRVAEENFL